MPRNCSRCGREQRPHEAAELGELLSTMASELDPARGVFAGAAPWAQIGGADVCPRCLTSHEERSLALDYIELVEAEVARVRKAGTDPQSYEAALIAYAMVLRSRISDVKPAQELEVAITGAFLTGQPLEARISEYSRFQRALGDALRDLPDQGWDYVRWRGVSTYASGGGYASMVPLILVHRDDGEFLARAKHVFNERPEPERRWLDELMRGWDWRLRSMRVEVYDIGVAVIVGTYDLRLPIGAPLDIVPEVIDAVVRLRPDHGTQIRSPVATTFQALAEETVSQFTGAVNDHAPVARQEPWLTPFLDALSREAASEAQVVPVGCSGYIPCTSYPIPAPATQQWNTPRSHGSSRHRFVRKSICPAERSFRVSAQASSSPAQRRTPPTWRYGSRSCSGPISRTTWKLIGGFSRRSTTTDGVSPRAWGPLNSTPSARSTSTCALCKLVLGLIAISRASAAMSSLSGTSSPAFRSSTHWWMPSTVKSMC